ncbi:MAG TPA: hypothetical protein VJB64_00145 [Patescibacteria group bacterium]|nr:hypothetical protein [Patescibacteria group bacterium]
MEKEVYHLRLIKGFVLATACTLFVAGMLYYQLHAGWPVQFQSNVSMISRFIFWLWGGLSLLILYVGASMEEQVREKQAWIIQSYAARIEQLEQKL